MGQKKKRQRSTVAPNFDAIAEARFHTLAYAIDRAVLVVDAANIIRFSNPTAEELLEAGPDGMVGQPAPIALRHRPAADSATLELPSGRCIEIDIGVAATVWDDQIAWLGILTPRSVKQDAFASVDAALEAMRTRFFAHVNHELRTPLNSVLGFAEFLMLELHGPLGTDSAAAARYRDYARDIHRSGTRLLAMISDMIELAQPLAGEPALQECRFDLAALMTDLLPQAEVRVRERLPDTAPTLRLGAVEPILLMADRDRIARAMLHLLENGLAFARRGGSVMLSATTARDGRVLISVTDDGEGFSSPALVHAFQPLPLLRPGDLADPQAGAGLGLALVRQTFELHGGAVRIDSGAEGGTRVTCSLPRHRVALAPPAAGGPRLSH